MQISHKKILMSDKLFHIEKNKWYKNNKSNRAKFYKSRDEWKLGYELMLNHGGHIVKKTARNIQKKKQYKKKQKEKLYSGGFFLKYTLISSKGETLRDPGRYISIIQKPKSEFKKIIDDAKNALLDDYPPYQSGCFQIKKNDIEVIHWNVTNLLGKKARIPTFGDVNNLSNGFKLNNHIIDQLALKKIDTEEIHDPNYDCLLKNIWYQCKYKIIWCSLKKYIPKENSITHYSEFLDWINKYRYETNQKSIKQTKGMTERDIQWIVNHLDIQIYIFDIHLNKWIEHEKKIKYDTGHNSNVYLLGHNNHVVSIHKKWIQKIKNNTFNLSRDNSIVPIKNLNTQSLNDGNTLLIHNIYDIYNTLNTYVSRIDNKQYVLIWTCIITEDDENTCLKCIEKYGMNIFKYKGDILSMTCKLNNKTIIIKNAKGYLIENPKDPSLIVDLEESLQKSIDRAYTIAKVCYLNIHKSISYAGLGLQFFQNNIDTMIDNISLNQRYYFEKMRFGGVNKVYCKEHKCDEHTIILEIDRKSAYPTSAIGKKYPRFFDVDTLQNIEDINIPIDKLLTKQGFIYIEMIYENKSSKDKQLLEELCPYGNEFYTIPQIKKAKSLGLDYLFVMKKVIYSSSEFEGLFDQFFNKLNDIKKNYKEYASEIKSMMNSLIGMLKCKNKHVKIVHTQSKAEAARLFFNSKEQYLKIIKDKKHTWYEVGFNNQNNRSLPHLYNYILGYHQIDMIDLYRQLLDIPNIKFLQKITDCYQIAIDKKYMSIISTLCKTHQCQVKFCDGYKYLGYGIRNYRIDTFEKNKFYGVEQPNKESFIFPKTKNWDWTCDIKSSFNLPIKNPITDIEFDNIYLTKSLAKDLIIIEGKAGSGKSTQLSKIVEELEKHSLKVCILAPSGIASINVNGKTIESVIGYNKSKSESIHRIQTVDYLLIDEYGMISLERFYHCYDIFKSKNPNLKCILFGDKNQLENIDGQTIIVNELKLDYECFNLNKNWRQKDSEFIDCIETTLKTGSITNMNFKTISLSNLMNKKFEDVNLILVGDNACAEQINNLYFESCKHKQKVYKFRVWGDDVYHDEFKSHAKKNKYVSTKIKKNLKCIICENIYNSKKELLFANGHIVSIQKIKDEGIEVKCLDQKTGLWENDLKILPMQKRTKLKFETIHGKVKLLKSYCEYLPLKPCKALTVHKVQSLTLKCPYGILWNSLWNNKLKYVALSRAISKNQITIIHS